jgi:hypothetical protein
VKGKEFTAENAETAEKRIKKINRRHTQMHADRD